MYNVRYKLSGTTCDDSCGVWSGAVCGVVRGGKPPSGRVPAGCPFVPGLFCVFARYLVKNFARY